MKKLIYFFLLAALVSCQNFEYRDNDTGIKRKRTSNYANNEGGDVNDIVKVSDLKVRADDFKDAITSEGCESYKSSTPNFKLTEGLFKKMGVTHPISALENCVSKGIDDAAKPICEREQQLLKAEKKYSRRDDAEADEALSQIDEALAVIDELKGEMEYAIYDLLDASYDFTDDVYDDIEDKRGIEGSILRLLVKSELESPSRVLRAKALNICSFTGTTLDLE